MTQVLALILYWNVTPRRFTGSPELTYGWPAQIYSSHLSPNGAPQFLIDQIIQNFLFAITIACLVGIACEKIVELRK